jgi:hypothetical protein
MIQTTSDQYRGQRSVLRLLFYGATPLLAPILLMAAFLSNRTLAFQTDLMLGSAVFYCCLALGALPFLTIRTISFLQRFVLALLYIFFAWPVLFAFSVYFVGFVYGEWP